MGILVGSGCSELRGEDRWCAGFRDPWDVRSLLLPEIRTEAPGLLALRLAVGRTGIRGLADQPPRAAPLDDARVSLLRSAGPEPRALIWPFAPRVALRTEEAGIRLEADIRLELAGTGGSYRIRLETAELELQAELECPGRTGWSFRLGRFFRSDLLAGTARGWLRDREGRRELAGPCLLSRSRGRDLRRVSREGLLPTGGLEVERGLFPGLGALATSSWRIRRFRPIFRGAWFAPDGRITPLEWHRIDEGPRRPVEDRCLGRSEAPGGWRGAARGGGIRLEYETLEGGSVDCPVGQLIAAAVPARLRLRTGDGGPVLGDGGLYRELLDHPRKGRRHGV